MIDTIGFAHAQSRGKAAGQFYTEGPQVCLFTRKTTLIYHLI